ncbi:MAG: hypothetical protein JW934_05075 [Anaerolineae bacterium]|nr:hypothetical protein [Anaerolineae bacterium]
MTKATLAQELAFVVVQSHLTGCIARQEVLAQLGPDALAEIEYQRDVLKRDVAWGMRHV